MGALLLLFGDLGTLRVAAVAPAGPAAARVADVAGPALISLNSADGQLWSLRGTGGPRGDIGATPATVRPRTT